MLRMSKMTDYGTLVLSQLAAPGLPEAAVLSATEVAQRSGLAAPTVSKLLKALTRAALVVSYRGTHGGYALARPPENITAAEIIDALEGPISITECSAADSHCELESICELGSRWQRINLAIRAALDEISLRELTGKTHKIPLIDIRGALLDAATPGKPVN